MSIPNKCFHGEIRKITKKKKKSGYSPGGRVNRSYTARLGLELIVRRVNSYFFTRLPGAQGFGYTAAGRINRFY